MNSEIVTLDFEVTPAGPDVIVVNCPGEGVATGQTFHRASIEGVAGIRHTPHSLAAEQWYANHPPAPAWKVGDIVPKDTAVGKRWTAAPIRTREEALRQCATGAEYGVLPMNVDPDGWCREARRILWIEES